MADAVSTSESQIVQELVRKGLDAPEALVAVLLLTRTYCRPKSDLVDTLRQYPSLQDRDKTQAAIDRLIHRGWLTVEDVEGLSLVGPSPDLRVRLAQFADRSTLKGELTALQRNNDNYVRIIGALRDQEAFLSFLSLLRTSQSHIYFSGIATAAFDHEATPIIEDRAQAGVVVKVLLAEPQLAATLRGKQMYETAKQRLQQWKEIARRQPHLEVRVTDTKDDLLLASSASIDARVLRLVIYDFDLERSKQGIVVEFSTRDNRSLNAILDFERNFLRAWTAARPVSSRWKVLWYIRQLWQFGTAALLATLCYAIYQLAGKGKYFSVDDNSVALAVAIVSSVAASFVFTGLVEAGKAASSKKGRTRSKTQ